MTFTEDDLRATLAHRAQAGLPPDQTDPLAVVRGRIRRSQLRRGAGVSALAAAAIALAVLTPWAGPPASHRLRPATGAADGAYPAYTAGGKALGGLRAQLSGGGATRSFTVTPTSYRLFVRATCAGGGPAPASRLAVAVSVNGHRPGSADGCAGRTGGSSTESGLGSSGNSGGFAAAFGQDHAYWAGLGVRPGHRSTITVHLVVFGSGALPNAPAAERATVEVALYQRVPASSYPFPPRPAALAPLPSPPAAGAGVDARSAGPNGHGSFPVTAAAGATATVTCVAPGKVTLSVAGHPVGVAECWDYASNSDQISLSPTDLRALGVPARAGQPLTVTVAASRFADRAWSVSARG